MGPALDRVAVVGYYLGPTVGSFVAPLWASLHLHAVHPILGSAVEAAALTTRRVVTQAQMERDGGHRGALRVVVLRHTRRLAPRKNDCKLKM